MASTWIKEIEAKLWVLSDNDSPYNARHGHVYCTNDNSQEVALFITDNGDKLTVSDKEGKLYGKYIWYKQTTTQWRHVIGEIERHYYKYQLEYSLQQAEEYRKKLKELGDEEA